MSSHRHDVLIVGAGHAGVQVAATLRKESFEGSIGILTADNDFPYDRPALTKGYLGGNIPESDLLLKPPTFWSEAGIELLLNKCVNRLVPSEHAVFTEGGEKYEYGRLVWAAGADPIHIDVPGSTLEGVHHLRSLADTRQFKSDLTPGAQVVVVGGGYIGLETASACVSAGLKVTVVEAQSRLLSRVTGLEVADHLLHKHRSEGVTVELDASLVAIQEKDGRPRGITLSDGRELPADVVLLSVGIRPNVGVLEEAGIVCKNGVVIDTSGRTNLPDVYAAGDCTTFPITGDSYLRLESLQNAVDQGEHVALSIMGSEQPYSLVPYFWSNQYDVKIKTLGLFSGYDTTVRREGIREGSFSVVYLREDRVCAVDAVNHMKDYVDAHQVVGQIVNLDVIRDSSMRLREAKVVNQEEKVL